MQTLEALQRQIDSAQDLQSVVKTMKAIAAVSIRQFEQATESIRQYNRAVEMGLQVLLKRRPPREREELRPRPPAGVIVFGSAQGMCGQFNEELVRFASGNLRSRGLGSDQVVLAAAGVKASGLMEAHGYRADTTLSVPSSVEAITSGVRQILALVQQWRSGSQLEWILLYFNEFKGGASFEPASHQLLPLDQEWLVHLAAREWQSRALPTYRGNWQEAFAGFVQQHLFVTLYRALAESLTSENASRLAAMQGAQKNIDERLEELQETFNRRRQNSITSELLDIASGYEALRGEMAEDEE
jgi:F-type H+-transporting ATPase subunit gamma